MNAPQPRLFRRRRRRPRAGRVLLGVGIGLIALFALLALAQATLVGHTLPHNVYDPQTGMDPNVVHNPSPPSWHHPLGTDPIGRDLLAEVAAGAGPALLIGLSAGLGTAVVALVMASTSATWRRADGVLGHVSQVTLLLPAPLLVLILGTSPVGQSLPALPFGLLFGLVFGSSSGALVLRARALPIMQSGFIDAARVSGAGRFAIARRHLFPHLAPLAASYVFLGAVGAVITDGFAAWHGLVVGRLSWGLLMYQSLTFSTITGKLPLPTLMALGVSFTLFLLGFYLAGAGMRRRDEALRLERGSRARRPRG